MMRQLWNDEGGVVVSAELVLVGTILVIGLITGLSSLRDGVITELADVGAAIGRLNQSYVLHGARGHSAKTAGTHFHDGLDFCDGDWTQRSERCLVICDAGTAKMLDNEAR